MKQYDEMTEDEKNKLNDLEITTAEEIMGNYNKLMENYNSLQQENTNLKMQIDELKKEKSDDIEPLRTWYSCESSFNDSRAYIDSNAEMVYEKINEIISKLKEVKK